jgi:hypothetical protein
MLELLVALRRTIWREQVRALEEWARQNNIVDYEEKRIRITVKPGEFIEVSWSGRWFTRRVEGWKVGEVILKDDRLLIPFKSTRVIEVRDVVHGTPMSSRSTDSRRGWASSELT